MTDQSKSDEVRDRLYEQFARIGKAMSHPRRLEIIELLAQGERSVEILANVARLTVANTSQHLQQLRQAGLVASRKEGLRVYYRLAGMEVIELLQALQRLGESNLAEVDRLLRAYRNLQQTMEPVKAVDLLERMRKGNTTLLDVRPAEEYAAAHVSGAVNIPLDEIEQRVQELSDNQEIIAYCRGYFCLLADEAVTRLRDQGINARRMEYGFPQWQLDGYPVESGDTQH